MAEYHPCPTPPVGRKPVKGSLWACACGKIHRLTSVPYGWDYELRWVEFTPGKPIE